MKEDPSKDRHQAFNAWQLVMNFFLETVALMALGFFAGAAIDSRFFEDRHIFVFILLFLGLAASLVDSFRKAMKITGGGNQDENQKSGHD
ncbi:MAG TPA: AtpZ/AtpI family protein [Bacillota bacterium]|nr:AtpZ/AtpI family protein [Bacillota bacterium]HPJ86267.1 AtpZ/AtpI family protein [Bacillota bacterium]HPQ62406.1 AtpZ/AtpI family protein [Bacillota bacterium]HRX91969.1 AtpZ/AtpI family protein [Candidatus Izemoplasmatales bacterium]